MLARAILAGVAGVLLSLAFEPVALPVLLPLALAGFALATRGLTVRSGWVPGLVFGVGFYFVHIYWMRASIGTGAWLALAGLEALFYALLGSVAAVLHRLRWWPVWLAAAWVTMELVRSYWPFSGMPWGRLAFATVDTAAADALAYVGMNGLSFLLALIGFLLGWLVTRRGRSERLVAGGVLVLTAAVTVLPSVLPYELDETGSATVAVVQGDVPGRGNDVLVDTRQLTENHVQATLDLAADVRSGTRPAPDFVVWPENSTANDPFADAALSAAIQRAAEAVDVPILVGAMVDAGEDHVLNQGIVWDPETGAGERYTKRHPVAFGEYIPFRSLVASLGLEDAGQLARISRDMLTGTREEPLRIAGVPVADAICFDVAYDDGFYAQVRNGAELLAVQTSNASFIFTDQIDQQFAMTRLRAIESGKYLTVASTNGITGVIAPDGSVLATADPLTRAVLVEEVGLRPGVTPGIRVGSWLKLLLPLVAGVGIVVGALTYRRERRNGPPPEPQSAPVRAPDEEVTT